MSENGRKNQQFKFLENTLAFDFMSLIHSILGLANLICVLTYFFKNASIGSSDSAGLIFLILSFFFGSVTLIILLMKPEKIRINTSLFLILIFFLYIVIKGCLDLESTLKLKEITIGTTGGMFLFFSLGLFVYLGIYSLFLVKTRPLNGFFFLIRTFIIFLVYLFLLSSAISNIMGEIRSNILLLDHSVAYQRPANLLVISYIILSYTLILHIYKASENRSLLRKPINWTIVTLYIVIGVFQMFFIQVIGSNTGLVMTLGIMCLTIPFVLLGLINKRKLDFWNRGQQRLKTGLFSFQWKPIIQKSFVTILILCLLIYGFTWYFDFDITKTRFFGYGKTSGIATRSFSSREKILQDNLLIHLSYNPLFGNMMVEQHTTGKGTFIHSFIITLQTHLGLIGLLLFSLLYSFVLRFILGRYNQVYLDVTPSSFLRTALKIYLFITLLFIILAGAISTFYTWIPFWFSIGLFGSLIYEKKYGKAMVIDN